MTWYGHPPHGVVVTGLPGHEDVGAHTTANHPTYDDPVLAELDPVPLESIVGRCRECKSTRCAGVKWAIARLRNRLSH